MSARNRKPKPGEPGASPPVGEAGEADEAARLRERLAEVSLRLAESERRRVEAESRLAVADESFPASLDGLTDGVLINRSIRNESGRIVDFRIVYSNEAASRISGVPREELIDHRILDLFPGRLENGQFDAYVRVVETGQPLLRNSVKDHDVPDRSDPIGFGRDFEVSVTRFGDGYIATLHDIVARRRIEEELFRAQQMLRLVLDTVPQRVFWKDTESVFVGCNAAFARDAGFSDPAEIIGKTDHDLPWQGLADEYAVDEMAVLRTGRPKLGFDESQIRADGSHSWVRVSKVPLLDGDGRVVGVLGTYEDVTDRRKSEEALRDNERFLADILDNLPSMVYVKDANTLTFVRVNRATELILGYTNDELVSPDSRKLGPADESDYFAQMDQKVVDTGQLLEFPVEVLTTRDRGTLYLRTKKVPLFDDQGKPKYVLGISEDITDLKVLEEARRESEARYRHIIDTITDYVVSMKVDRGRPVGIAHGPGCVAVTGYTADELAADPDLWLNLAVAEDRELSLDRFQRSLSGERLEPYEYRINRKDGAVRWVRQTPVLRLDADGTPVAYDGLIQDITERRALQDQLLQSQKMEGIGRLAGGVAHDFNNLLTAILGYVEMCKLDLPADLPADHPARLDLQEVATAGERAASLTRQLLTFASRQIVAPVRLDLSTLVADSLKMLQRLLGDDIEIETALDPGVGTVEADSGQIQQLLVNLTVNARDAMPEGGRLLIETADEDIDEESARAHPGASPGPYVLLAVADTGVGMADEVRAHLFEPFFTTKELGKGTGLGLATCHGIVKSVGGHIRVYSEPGQGTTFRIYLPRKTGAADPQPAAAPPRPMPTGSETVLVVEDEPRVRRLAVLGLRAHGYVVLEASDGAEALRTAELVGSEIDVIVSDVMMPGMSGPELLKRLEVIAPQARAVLMSGHAESTVLSQMPDLRGVFLPKPFTPERLARKVREVLDAPESP
jgi:PAS domain S-box-containing protein